MAFSTTLTACYTEEITLRAERDFINRDNCSRDLWRMYRINFTRLEHGKGLFIYTIEKSDKEASKLLGAMSQSEIVGYVFLVF